MGVLALPQSATAAERLLQIVVSNVDTRRGGELVVCLYREGENWLDMSGAYRIARSVPTTSTFNVTFTIPEGGSGYAVQVLHDVNGDGKANFRIFPPKMLEGFGFSNDYVPRMKPDYAAASFVPVDGDAVLVQMAY